MSRIRSTFLAGLVVSLLVIGQGATASADELSRGKVTAETEANSGVVRTWNAHAIAALTNPNAGNAPGLGQAPPVSALHLAMIQGAVYDAVIAIEGGYEPYLGGLGTVSPDASLDAAVATAAHDVLLGIIPDTPDFAARRAYWSGVYDTFMGNIPAGEAKSDGEEIGAAAAAAMLGARSTDGRFGPFRFSTGTDIGEWRPVPPGNGNDPNAWVAEVVPFVISDAADFRTKGPLPVDSPSYARDYDEVKSLGGSTSVRTPEQQAVADFYTINPIVTFNPTLRAIADSEGLTVVEEARLFAMTNVSAADAFIACWDDKAAWGFWRPLTAIREGDNDGNARTVGDPTWSAYMATPPYPDHPSGYNCATAAIIHAAIAFFGHDRMEFSVVKPGSSDVIRDYQRFSDVVDDTIDARVYLGFHFRTADEQGATLGERVARFVSKHAFERVH